LIRSRRRSPDAIDHFGASDDRSDLYVAIDQVLQPHGGDYELDESRHDESDRRSNEHMEQLLANSACFRKAPFMNASNVTVVHHVNKALRRNKLFKRDKDYIVRRAKSSLRRITGRMMPAAVTRKGCIRRSKPRSMSDPAENVTLASITFRIFPPLRQLRDDRTAATEADEFARNL